MLEWSNTLTLAQSYAQTLCWMLALIYLLLSFNISMQSQAINLHLRLWLCSVGRNTHVN